jgi:hypothetical protein
VCSLLYIPLFWDQRQIELDLRLEIKSIFGKRKMPRSGEKDKRGVPVRGTNPHTVPWVRRHRSANSRVPRYFRNGSRLLVTGYAAGVFRESRVAERMLAGGAHDV